MAKPKPLPGTFSLLRDAWEFSSRHTALPWIAFWLLAVPGFALSLIDELSTQLPAETTEVTPLLVALVVIAIIACVALLTWGTAAVLVVGRRQIQNRAGRSRTSLASVCSEAEPLILPLIGTSILQSIFLAYRALLYVVPTAVLLLLNSSCTEELEFGVLSAGCTFPPVLLLPLLVPMVLYGIQTVFYQVVLATENLAFREGLARSRTVVGKRTGKLLPTLIGLLFVCYGPAILVSALLGETTATRSFGVTAAIVGIESLVMAIGMLFFLLSLTALYGALREQTVGKEVKLPRLLGRGSKRKNVGGTSSRARR